EERQQCERQQAEPDDDEADYGGTHAPARLLALPLRAGAGPLLKRLELVAPGVGARCARARSSCDAVRAPVSAVTTWSVRHAARIVPHAPVQPIELVLRRRSKPALPSTIQSGARRTSRTAFPSCPCDTVPP